MAARTVPNKAVDITAHPLNVSVPVRSLSIDINHLPKEVHDYIEEKANICQPDSIYICDGTDEEYKDLLEILQRDGWITKLEKMNNWYT